MVAAWAPVKAPLYVAEQLAFNDGGADGGAVHGDEGAFRPGAMMVDGPGHQFLPTSGLSLDEDGRIAGDCVNDQLSQIQHGRGISQQPIEAELNTHFRFQCPPGSTGIF